MAVKPDIDINHDVFVNTAKILREVADGLSATARRAGSRELAPSSFGLMNSWMVSPITSVAARSADLITSSSSVVAATANATDAAARDWSLAEQSMIDAINAVGTTLDEVAL